MVSAFSSVVNKLGYFHHSLSIIIMRSLSSFPQLFRDLIADAQDRLEACSTGNFSTGNSHKWNCHFASVQTGRHSLPPIPQEIIEI
ncbi:MAG: hypothetical protein F6J92_16690 [Symploca sp. SIO1A3]|nr:hypothetical protein [Symploca sp. SIO1A3]